MADLRVHAQWDIEAGVWTADSSDVPGLATEADTIEALLAKVSALIPELLEANNIDIDATQFELMARRATVRR